MYCLIQYIDTISQAGRRNSSTATDHGPGQGVFFWWKHASLVV
jgi:hypothetical protein